MNWVEVFKYPEVILPQIRTEVREKGQKMGRWEIEKRNSSASQPPNLLIGM